jgi:hypothetical protein
MRSNLVSPGGGTARGDLSAAFAMNRAKPFRSHAANDWKAAFTSEELIASHGAECPMPDLLGYVAARGCSRAGSH